MQRIEYREVKQQKISYTYNEEPPGQLQQTTQMLSWPSCLERFDDNC